MSCPVVHIRNRNAYFMPWHPGPYWPEAGVVGMVSIRESGLGSTCCRVFLDSKKPYLFRTPENPTFLGFLIMISLYKSLKQVGSLGFR